MQYPLVPQQANRTKKHNTHIQMPTTDLPVCHSPSRGTLMRMPYKYFIRKAVEKHNALLYVLDALQCHNKNDTVRKQNIHEIYFTRGEKYLFLHKVITNNQ